MELTWLEDFLALARDGSFSKAADVRGVTQPAFSRRIRALERWLGVILIDRDTHRTSLTAAGSRFVEIADTALRNLEHGRRELQEIANVSQSSLRIAATHALSLIFFPGWLQALGTPEVSVQLTADNMLAAEHAMLQGRVQFLLCHHHPAAATVLDQRNFISVTVGNDSLIPVSISLPDGRGARHALPGHADAPVGFLEYGPESGMGRIMTAARATEGPIAHLASVFCSHAVMVLAAMARAGRGVAWLPESLVRQDLADGLLVTAGDDSWNIPMEVRLYRARARQSLAAESFWAMASAGPHPC